ncbi:MAG: hypothetical protein OD814_000939 [Candidatus Alkanophagales archaeon MCA70_species_1]|nr:hypothetical protein [Candidatus Alkanophaga volatiphilum]
MTTLSIPPWSDFFRKRSRWTRRPSSTLSIPPWSDFFRRLPQRGRHLASLSIPPWSDFFPAMNLLIWAARCIFQSHLGLISFAYRSCSQHSTPSRFQSHLGLISFPYRGYGWICEVWFQSHLGLISFFMTKSMRWQRRYVSIPPWSDFFRSKLILFVSIHNCFNPTLV